MKRTMLTSAAVLLSSAAFAQTTTSPAETPPANRPAAVATANKAGTSVRQQITADLQQAGFTNIKVVPDSFVVQATDKSGHPVTMFLSPNSMTVFSEEEATNREDQQGDRGIFTSVPAKDELSSQVVGLDVYNGANQKIGKIQNIAFDQNNLKAYILGVGGFIGMGEHDVAVRPSAISINYNAGEKKWHATTELTADQLKAAPDAMRIDAQATSGGMFTSIEPTDDLNSKISGLNVHNKDNQTIGTIKDIAFNANGVKAYILGVGGFLSVGERYVAVRPSALTLSYNNSDRKWHAEMDADAGQLKAAPQYKYANAY
jgi:sporulation protein YlmC with PRC-barrel domain